jgi:hypothetical protein
MPTAIGAVVQAAELAISGQSAAAAATRNAALIGALGQGASSPPGQSAAGGVQGAQDSQGGH